VVPISEFEYLYPAEIEPNAAVHLARALSISASPRPARLLRSARTWAERRPIPSMCEEMAGRTGPGCASLGSRPTRRFRPTWSATPSGNWCAGWRRESNGAGTSVASPPAAADVKKSVAKRLRFPVVGLAIQAQAAGGRWAGPGRRARPPRRPGWRKGSSEARCTCRTGCGPRRERDRVAV